MGWCWIIQDYSEGSGHGLLLLDLYPNQLLKTLHTLFLHKINNASIDPPCYCCAFSANSGDNLDGFCACFDFLQSSLRVFYAADANNIDVSPRLPVNMRYLPRCHASVIPIIA